LRTVGDVHNIILAIINTVIKLQSVHTVVIQWKCFTWKISSAKSYQLK